MRSAPPLSFDEMVTLDFRLKSALSIAALLNRGWHSYELFKKLLRTNRIAGHGARVEALATNEAYEIAVRTAADYLEL